MNSRIILASSSPRRRQILSHLIDDFNIIKPETEEIPEPGESPRDFALRTAYEKAEFVLNVLAGRGNIVIAADTIVTFDNHILGKPSNHTDAVRMLSLLSGREHHVITALCLACSENIHDRKRINTRCETTAVRFRKLSGAEILDYLESIEFMDKAGSYAFQENGSLIIEEVRGSVTNVIGFPLRLFFAMCGEMDITGRVFQEKNMKEPCS